MWSECGVGLEGCGIDDLYFTSTDPNFKIETEISRGGRGTGVDVSEAQANSIRSHRL